MATIEDLNKKLETLGFLIDCARASQDTWRKPYSDPTKGQGRVLAFLKLKEGISAKDMRTILGMGTSSLNEILQKLERTGMIERRQSSEDGRIVLIYLTEEGRNFKQAEPEPPNLFSDFSPDEINQLSDYLDRMTQTLKEQLGDDVVRAFENERKRRRELLSRMIEGTDEDHLNRRAERVSGREEYSGESFDGGYPLFERMRGAFPSFGRLLGDNPSRDELLEDASSFRGPDGRSFRVPNTASPRTTDAVEDRRHNVDK